MSTIPTHPMPTDSAMMVAALSVPDAYPWHPEAVDVIETHISWVFLAGDFVVKVKRPVTFGFVDHATAEARRTSCEEEVRLNRRLSTGIYLDVVPITREPEGYAIEGLGPAVEWATLMRRLPAGGMLDRLLATRAAPPDLAERLAGRLIPFHTTIAEERGHTLEGRPEALIRVVTDNLEELTPFAGAPLSGSRLRRIATAMRAFIGANAPLLATRSNGGFVRDGHGDLRCEHVCLDDSAIQIFDCIEFNPAIRCTDVASDLAFLLMDLDRLGAARTAEELVGHYRAAGVDLPPALVRFYRAHRALVRAKVACLTRPGLHPEAVTGLEREARHYLDLATREVTEARPALIAMSGLSGTGKSTAAAAIARATGAAVHASDAVRKELAGVDGSAAADWQAGIYTPEWTERTYARLLELAEGDLRAGRPALLDAAFPTTAPRERAAAVAARIGAPLLIVEVRCRDDVARARITARQRAGESRSDADWGVHRRQRDAWQASPPGLPAGALSVVLDSTTPDPDWVEPALAALEQADALRYSWVTGES